MSTTKLVVSVGSSRSGKSAFVMQQVKNDKRVIVWNEKDNEKDQSNWSEKNGFTRVYKQSDLIALIKSHQKKNLRVCYVPSSLGDFDWFCRVAKTWGIIKPATIIVEELSDVTSPGKAPESWGQICRKMLGYDCDIYAITQRPAESDKTAIGNASMVHCGRLQLPIDRKYMSGVMGIPVNEFDKLEPLDWLESYAIGKWKKGKLTF